MRTPESTLFTVPVTQQIRDRRNPVATLTTLTPLNESSAISSAAWKWELTPPNGVSKIALCQPREREGAEQPGEERRGRTWCHRLMANGGLWSRCCRPHTGGARLPQKHLTSPTSAGSARPVGLGPKGSPAGLGPFTRSPHHAWGMQRVPRGAQSCRSGPAGRCGQPTCNSAGLPL